MIGQHFAEKLGNPRDQRAYTHALLDKARSSGNDADFATALGQVEKIVCNRQPKKTADSHFERAIVGVAAADPMVRRVGVVANDVLQHVERKVDARVGTEDKPADIVSASLESPYFALGRTGAIMHMMALRDRATGRERVYSFGITDHAGDRFQYPIPFGSCRDGTPVIDAVELRLTPPEMRLYLGMQAGRIMTLNERDGAVDSDGQDATPELSAHHITRQELVDYALNQNPITPAGLEDISYVRQASGR